MVQEVGQMKKQMSRWKMDGVGQVGTRALGDLFQAVAGDNVPAERSEVGLGKEGSLEVGGKGA